MGICNLYIRWRHSRGFGVHSPFAFAVVTNVVQRHYRYYGYDDIVDGIRGPHMGKRLRRALMMHRLVARLGLTLSHHAGMPEHLLTAVRSAGGDACADTAHPRLCYYSASAAEASGNSADPSPTDALPDGSVLWVEGDSEWAERAFASLKGGLLLRGRDLSLVFHRRQMAPTRYDILL